MALKRFFAVPGQSAFGSVALLLIALGPGRLSLDRQLFGKRQ